MFEVNSGREFLSGETISSEKLPFSKLFPSKQIPPVCGKSVFEKLCFYDGIVWTVPNRRNKTAISDVSVVAL